MSSTTAANSPDTPAVSIITATRNRPDLLREALASIRAQTRADWEHLVVDDGSDDPAVRDILHGASRDPRVRPHFAPWSGDRPSKRWNEMLDRARGQYVCFLDDDNLKSPNFVEEMAGYLDASPDVDCVTCGWTVIGDGPPREEHLNLLTDSDIARRNTIDTGSFLVRRRALERAGGYFDEALRTNEDWWLAKRMAASMRMTHLGTCLATYRVNKGQRMDRCWELGNAADKEFVRWATWDYSGDVGAECHASISALENAHSPTRWLRTAFETSARLWIRPGNDLAVTVMPWAEYFHFGTRWTLVAFPDAPTRRDLDFLRNASRIAADTKKGEVWALGTSLEAWSVLAEAVGDRAANGASRALCCSLTPLSADGWQERAGRIVNSIRCRRYGAEIP